MKTFNLHFKNGKKELKMDVQGLDSAEELKIIADMVKALNINMRNQTDYFEEDKLEVATPASIKKLAEGYQALAKEPIIEPVKVTERERFTSKNVNEKSEPKEASRLNIGESTFSQALTKAQVVSRNADWLEIQKHQTSYNVRYFGESDVPHFQAFYVCPGCGNKGKRYIKQDGNTIYCHQCNHMMHVRDAHEEGFPHTDFYDNFFVAGEYAPIT